MEFSRFVTLYLSFFINIFHKCSNSLLSRSKNTYLYVPKQSDYVESINVDDVYNALKEEVPGIQMFKNEIGKVFKNVFNTRLQTGRQRNRNIFAKGIRRKKIMILSTESPVTVLEKKVSDMVWRKIKTSSTQSPEMVRNWHYISRILPTSTTPYFFIIHSTKSEPHTATNTSTIRTDTSTIRTDFFSSATKTSTSTPKINTTAIFQFMPIPSSWKEDDDDDDSSSSEDDDDSSDDYDDTKGIIINFENYTYKIPYTTIAPTKKVTTTTTTQFTTTTSIVQATTTTVTHSPNTSMEQTTKHQLPDNFVIFDGTRKAQCYRCGTDTDLSQNSFCHDVFNSDNYEYLPLTRLLRTTCYDNPSVKHGDKVKWPKGYDEFKLYQYTDEGLESKFYGSYSGGCFKRFLDIGNFHTQRGCRQWPPDGYRYRRGYYDHPTIQQYRILERKLGKTERDACVYSLHASLVPFSRDVSLFARHHVCVCTGRYCNAAYNICASFISRILGIIYLIKCYVCYEFFYFPVQDEDVAA